MPAACRSWLASRGEAEERRGRIFFSFSFSFFSLFIHNKKGLPHSFPSCARGLMGVRGGRQQGGNKKRGEGVGGAAEGNPRGRERDRSDVASLCSASHSSLESKPPHPGHRELVICFVTWRSSAGPARVCHTLSLLPRQRRPLHAAHLLDLTRFVGGGVIMPIASTVQLFFRQTTEPVMLADGPPAILLGWPPVLPRRSRARGRGIGGFVFRRRFHLRGRGRGKGNILFFFFSFSGRVAALCSDDGEEGLVACLRLEFHDVGCARGVVASMCLWKTIGRRAVRSEASLVDAIAKATRTCCARRLVGFFVFNRVGSFPLYHRSPQREGSPPTETRPLDRDLVASVFLVAKRALYLFSGEKEKNSVPERNNGTNHGCLVRSSSSPFQR